MRTVILYEDADILVCRKPAGLAVESANIAQVDMVSELKKYLKSPYLGIVHRLDQPVEGLLVFAKNSSAAAKLTAQLQGKILNKEYFALVSGKPDEAEGDLVDFLAKDAKMHVAKIVKSSEAKSLNAKKAHLNYRTLYVEEAEFGSYSLLLVQIETGRFHQIRAQLSHMGNPILGDRKYGTEESLSLSEKAGIRNVALCACKLEFIHPTTGKMMRYATQPENFGISFFNK